MDDHSWFVTGSEIHHKPTGEHDIQLPEASIVKHGKLDQILTDRGTQFYPARGETSPFTEFCSGNGIEHIIASVKRSPTIGKIEAFHKAYKYEAWMLPSHPQFVCACSLSNLRLPQARRGFAMGLFNSASTSIARVCFRSWF